MGGNHVQKSDGIIPRFDGLSFCSLSSLPIALRGGGRSPQKGQGCCSRYPAGAVLFVEGVELTGRHEEIASVGPDRGVERGDGQGLFWGGGTEGQEGRKFKEIVVVPVVISVSASRDVAGKKSRGDSALVFLVVEGNIGGREVSRFVGL